MGSKTEERSLSTGCGRNGLGKSVMKDLKWRRQQWQA
jgi:hypothetical protein